MSDPTSPAAAYQVVSHRSGRYSLWPSHRRVPAGWETVGAPAPRARCLAEIARLSVHLSRGNGEQAAAALPDERGMPAPAPAPAPTPASAEQAAPRSGKPALSLMFFGDDELLAGDEKYALLIDCAKFADQQGIGAIWLPERHFTHFGSLYPNPAILHAALAQHTRHLRLRAGSVVAPLHLPIRVVEDWSVVDNLSQGRAELSFASGWHPDDFAIHPAAYPDRKERMFAAIPEIRRLWRGESIEMLNGTGESITVRAFPTPVQSEIPIWVTAAGSPKTFEMAGKAGVHVVTHLFDQDVEGLRANIEVYQQALADAGHDVQQAQISVALHTFVAADLDEVRQHARQPYGRYLKSNAALIGKLAASRGMDVDLASIPEAEMDSLLNYMFEKFVGGRSFLGTPETCEQLAGELAEMGVTDIACLIDFGPPAETIRAHLPQLARLAELLRARA